MESLERMYTVEQASLADFIEIDAEKKLCALLFEEYLSQYTLFVFEGSLLRYAKYIKNLSNLDK